MELKKEQKAPAAKEDVLLKKHKTRDFVEDIKTEFKNITWTNKEELRVYTKIVVGATFVLGIGVYFIDLAIQAVLNSLTWLTRITVG